MPACRAALLVLTAGLFSLPGFAAEAPADWVFLNGKVYTLVTQRPWASAVAVRDGRIVYVGGDAGASVLRGPETRVTDLRGRMLMPGFHDSHMHRMAAGTRYLRCQLGGLAWPEEVSLAIARCAGEKPRGALLRGVDLTEAAFAGVGPHRSRLDELVTHRPAVITDRTGKLAWLSTAALDAFEIDADTPTPAHGSIEREPDSGAPTGVLRDQAGGLFYDKLPAPSSDELREVLRRASGEANRHGITSLNAAGVKPFHHAAYLLADEAGELTLRVQASLAWDAGRGPEQLGSLEQQRAEAGQRYYRADAAKLFADGGFHDETAALFEPYKTDSGSRGRLTYPPERMARIVTRLDAAGFQVHVHALGDRAVRTALDAFEHAIRVNGPADRRHQIAHVALIHPDDLPRFATLGVTPDVQPLWCYLDAERRAEVDMLGPERAGRLLALRTLFASNAPVVAGSDWVSESMSPLYGIQIAVTRRHPDGGGDAWLPEERVTLEEMLGAYTINGAWLARQEHLTGSVEVGKAADLIVLEKNLFEVDPMTLQDVGVDLTLLAGQPVFQSADFD